MNCLCTGTAADRQPVAHLTGPSLVWLFLWLFPPFIVVLLVFLGFTMFAVVYEMANALCSIILVHEMKRVY